MANYTHKERIMAAWRGEKTDRTSFFVDSGPHYSSQLNEKWPFSTVDDFFGSIETATDIQVKSAADFTSDIVAIPQAYFAWQGVKENYRFKTRPEAVSDNSIKTMEDLDEEGSQLEELLAQEDVYRDGPRVRQIKEQLVAISKRREQLMSRWESVDKQRRKIQL